MKKLIILLFVTFFYFPLISQDVVPKAESNLKSKQDSVHYVYCEIMTKLIKADKFSIVIIDGENVKPFSDETYPMNGQPEIFNAMIKASNAMAKEGWEIFQIYRSDLGYSYGIIHYLLRKRIKL